MYRGAGGVLVLYFVLILAPSFNFFRRLSFVSIPKINLFTHTAVRAHLASLSAGAKRSITSNARARARALRKKKGDEAKAKFP